MLPYSVRQKQNQAEYVRDLDLSEAVISKQP